jgi:hypothetical protein
MRVNIGGVSYQRSGQLIEQLEKEVEELLVKAERADSQGEMDPAKLPEEMAKRQQLKAKLEAARQRLEEPRSGALGACRKGPETCGLVARATNQRLLQIRQAPRLRSVNRFAANPLDTEAKIF